MSDSFEGIDKRAFELAALTWSAVDESERNYWRKEALKMPPDRFVQIVITRKPDGTFHVTWQDEHQVVKSGDYEGIGVIMETLSKMEVPSQERRFARA